MCNNFPNIRITEGNNFSIILPLLSRTYVATRPIDEEIDPEQLENVVVSFGGVQYPAQRTTRGVQIDLPATLAVGTYNILLTAEYLGSNIRAAYESAVTIVPWSEQSTAEQYITGSPIVLRAAYVLSGALTDAELEALKEEYREKNAQLDQAIADAEAAKREWEEKAADLDGVAKQGDNPAATNTAILEAVQQGGGTDIAKESTSQQILTKIGSPAQGQGADLFAAIAQAAGGGVTPEAVAQAVIAATSINLNYEGIVFSDGWEPLTAFDLVMNRSRILEVHDSEMTVLPMMTASAFSRIKVIEMTGATSCAAARGYVWMQNSMTLEILRIPRVVLTGSPQFFLNGVQNLKELDWQYTTDKDFSTGTLDRCYNLIDIKYGSSITDNTSILRTWAPTNALLDNSSSLVDEGEPFANNLEKLLYNIREHIAAYLPDRTGLSALTITFNAAVKAAILADQPTADAFTNKNWTIA